jgi:hypothetical protein
MAQRSKAARDFKAARWYQARRARSNKPATYTCPLCGGLLPAMVEHTLVFPDGDPARRRHAHSKCVARAHAAGRLPYREDVEPRGPGLFARLLARLRGD